MKVLITGGLGNVGFDITKRMIKEKHEVYVLARKINKKYKKRCRRLRKATLVMADLRDVDAVENAVRGMDYVIHLAAIVPPFSEEDYTRTYTSNVVGTENIIRAIKKCTEKPNLIYASSTSIMGPTQDKTPPITLRDRPNPINNYTKTKLNTENILNNHEVDFCIMRLASVMTKLDSYDMNSMKLLFDFPLDARNEIVLGEDVATACVNAIKLFEKRKSWINGQTFFIAGGKENGCQIENRDMAKGIFDAMGIGMPSERCFIKSMENYYMDWYDTTKSQGLLHYQNHTFGDYLKRIKRDVWFFKPIMKLMKRFMQASFKKLSPYYTKPPRH